MDEENNIINDLREENIVRDIRAKGDLVETEKLIEQRTKKLSIIFKKTHIWVLGLLIIAVILGVYIRSLPMQDHGGKPGLWDITTNTWTLGPDLDPWLFTRYAKTIIKQGSLPKIDIMRNVPLGFQTSTETRLLPYMIVWTYYLFNLFGEYSIEFAAAIFPVIMFALTIIFFFLFVREVFLKKEEKTTKANIIALISVFFMIVIPVFLSRTIAGIPEKESAGFFFMFIALYLFLRAWKSENLKISTEIFKPQKSSDFLCLKNSIILGILAGIATACLGLIWGGVIYVFITISIASLIAFLLNQVHKKELIIYFLWIVFSYAPMLLFSTRFSIKGLITSPNYGLPFVVFFIFLIHFILWNTPISKKEFFKRFNLSNKTISLIVAIILGIVLVVFILGPSFIINTIKYINSLLINPITGRWGQTVAENRQPYFTEWASSFGPFIKNIPILFWLFFIGSVVLFKNMLNKIKNKEAWILTGLYVLFFLGLVFSRYAPHPAVLDGEGFISRFFYFGSALLLIAFFIYYSIKYYKNKDDSFGKIDFSLLFLFSLFIICLISVRSAVRLIMVLGPIAVIFVGYLIVAVINKFKQTKDETSKIVIGALIVLILLLSFFVFFGNIITKTSGFYQEITSQAYSFVPSSYNQQWQKAMQWVRDETPKQAVFSHWWDYGYWVQSIGNRATVLDGGNAISYWNYLMGRLVLTGDNQTDALEFLYNHNATHLLIDSSDIGKYGAFSSIGSNKNFDRYSWMAAFLLDEKQIQETQNQTILVYPGGITLDEDLIIKENGKEILLPSGGAGIGAIIIPTQKKTGNETNFEQPYVIAVYQGQQYKVYLRYLAVQGKVIDFKSGINASAYIFPSLIVQGNGVNSNPIGAAMYLSPRLMRGMLVQVYILNDPFKNFPNFKLVHSEENLIVNSLNQQGMSLPEFIYYQGIQGPIKIWEIEYTGKEKIKQEYLDTDATKYLDWGL